MHQKNSVKCCMYIAVGRGLKFISWFGASSDGRPCIACCQGSECCVLSFMPFFNEHHE